MPRAEVRAEVRDLSDGSYELIWRSQRSGGFKARVTIGGSPLAGSPFQIRFAYVKQGSKGVGGRKEGR